MVINVKVNIMNKKISFSPNWKSLIKFVRDPEADWKPKLAVALAVIYLIWPIDLIPDLAPILGWLDDIGITAFVAGYLIYAVNHYAVKSDPEEPAPLVYGAGVGRLESEVQNHAVSGQVGEMGKKEKTKS